MARDNIVQSSKKEKKYRGMNIEELRKLDTREFAKLLKSRQRRFVLRNFHVIENFAKRARKKLEKNKAIKTHKRDIVIVPALVGMTISVYNGKEFTKITIGEEMLGHKLGEFSMTRKTVKHGAAGVGATKSSAALSVK